MTEKLICANCKALVARENIKAVKSFFICLCCLEYNHINFDALDQEHVVFSHKMKEVITKREQKRIEGVKAYY